VKRYVVGLAFTKDLQSVLLIKKNRPAWQAGYRNGLGGHVEPGESFVDAMTREFDEECGVHVAPADWRHFATLTGSDFELHFFSTVTDDILRATTKTDEVVGLMNVSHVQTSAVVPNLRWIVALALDPTIAVPVEFRAA
jgi:8-oxo-dGTP pyrophosphatase MutT (NUDIX family)